MKLLIQSLVITLVGLSFVGCKSSSNGNKVTTHRSNKPAQKGGGATTNGTDTNKPGKDSNNSTDSTYDPAKVKTKVCNKATPTGWESHVITSTKSDQTAQDGVQIHYLVPRNSSFKNPVLVLMNQLEPVSNELAEKILAAGNDNEFDPIILEPRGTGCSTPLPQDKKEWNQFTAEKVAEDAETLRKYTLKLQDKKWKVWSFQNSALVALKMVEMYPTTISSLHIVDFTIAKTPLEQEKNRLSTQIEAWTKFKEFSKSSGFEITADVEVEIKKVLLKDNSCLGNPSICKLELMTSFIDYISSDDTKWKEAIEIMKSLSEGEISKELISIAQKNQKNYLYNQLLIAAHLDSDPYLTACEKALNDNKLKKQAELTPIKTCSIDQAMKNSYLSELRGKVQHKKMNYDLIKKNLKAEKIELYLAVAERSLTNPLTSVNDTLEMLTGERELETLLTPESDNEIFFNEQLLETLK